MTGQVRDARLSRSLLGAVLWVPPWLAFCLGLGVRACLVNRPHFPQFLLYYSAALAFGGVVTYWQIALLLIIAGVVATFYIRVRILVISAGALALVACVAGYVVIGSAGCALVG